MHYYSEELKEEVRSANDIVDVISGYVRLQKKVAVMLGFARFIMKRRVLSMSLKTSSCIIVLDVAQEGMYLVS